MSLQEMCGEADHHEAHVLLVVPRYLLQDFQALGFPQQEIAELVSIRVYEVPLSVIEIVWYLILLAHQEHFSKVRNGVATPEGLLGYFFGLVGHRDVLGDVAIQDVIREEAEFCCLPVDLIEEDLTL
jgi:hypothetical protein